MPTKSARNVSYIVGFGKARTARFGGPFLVMMQLATTNFAVNGIWTGRFMTRDPTKLYLAQG